jgi:Cu(I)/Ag(I) efflux system membrane fusion protein
MKKAKNLKQMKKILLNKYIKAGLFLMAGIIIGWLFFHHAGTTVNKAGQTPNEKNIIWTCAMHPQIRMDKPGQCPICGMDLIPLQQHPVNMDLNTIDMTDEAIALANVQTSIAGNRNLVKEMRMYGKISVDERLIQIQPAYYPGRIERLMVNFTGEEVTKGQVIAVIYSPELATAQQELFETVKLKNSQPYLIEASEEKLRKWKLTDEQIQSIEESGKVNDNFEIKASFSGVVISKNVTIGDYVNIGTPLFEIANLSKVWVLFDAYESDLYWIKTGDIVHFTVQAIPGKDFSGIVSFIDRVINPLTRVARVRVEADNRAGMLKPEMFVTGLLEAQSYNKEKQLIVPKSAVLWTGIRSVVYVRVPDTFGHSFMLREVTLGPSTENGYVITNGLKEGEEIVTNGIFSVDAAAQLAGKPSMMNPQGGKTSTMPGMDMSNDSTSNSRQHN